jgi:hypothetical protein
MAVSNKKCGWLFRTAKSGNPFGQMKAKVQDLWGAAEKKQLPDLAEEGAEIQVAEAFFPPGLWSLFLW